jgi:hypothetical protein
MHITCKKDGFKDGLSSLEPKFKGMTLGNILIGGFIGIGVDAASGAIHTYPTNIIIPLQSKSGTATETNAAN